MALVGGWGLGVRPLSVNTSVSKDIKHYQYGKEKVATLVHHIHDWLKGQGHGHDLRIIHPCNNMKGQTTESSGNQNTIDGPEKGINQIGCHKTVRTCRALGHGKAIAHHQINVLAFENGGEFIFGITSEVQASL